MKRRRIDSFVLGGALALGGAIQRRVGEVDRRVDELERRDGGGRATPAAPAPSPSIPGMPLPTGYGLQVRGPQGESIVLPVCLPPGFELDSMMLSPRVPAPRRGERRRRLPGSLRRSPGRPRPSRKRPTRPAGTRRTAAAPARPAAPPARPARPDAQPSAGRLDGVLQLVFGADQRFSSSLEHSEDTLSSEPARGTPAPSRSRRAASIGRRWRRSTRAGRAPTPWSVGGGTSGPAVAGLLAESSSERVLVLEAGPDYGAHDSGRWPADLLDARAMPVSHAWGYDSGALYPERVLPFDRARVIGGCSSHNGCAALWGSRADYDGWGRGAAGRPTSCCRCSTRCRAGCAVRSGEDLELGPYHRAVLETVEASACRASPTSTTSTPTSARGRSRPTSGTASAGTPRSPTSTRLRDRPNLAVLGDAIVDRVELRPGGSLRVHAIHDGRALVIEAGRVVLTAGTYGTPAILLRSGIGPARDLERLGIDVVLDLPGVGGNLHDHPMAELDFSGSPELSRALADALEPRVRAGGADDREAALVALPGGLRSSPCARRGRATGQPAGRTGARSPSPA